MNIHQYPWISPNLLNGFPLGWSKKTTPTNPMKNLIKGWSSNQETRPSHKAPRLGLFWKKVSRKSISGVHVGRWKSHFFGTKMALSRKKKCGCSSKYGKKPTSTDYIESCYHDVQVSRVFFSKALHIMNSTPCSHFPMWEDWWCPPQLEWSQRRSLQSNLTASTGARFTALDRTTARHRPQHC